MENSTLILDHVSALYGQREGERCARQIASLLEEFRPLQAATAGVRGSLNQKDALLICYGDSLHKEGMAPLRTLSEFCETWLRGVVSGVHLLPHYPSTSDDGFAVTDFLEVNPALGTWADVARLSRSFDLMFDAVVNHMSAGSEWFLKFLAGFPSYRNYFVTVQGAPDLSAVVRPRALPLLTEFPSATGPRQVWTTFSADQVDLNFRNPKVLLAILRAILFYAQHGARFIRLDAIAYLWKQIGTPCIHLPETHRIIQIWRAVLDEVAPHVLLITETNVPHADNISYFGDGANEAQMVYNFALPPLVLHALLRGNGAYLAQWAATLAPPSDRTTFFNFLASHDGIGLNPVRDLLPPGEIDFLIGRCHAHGGFISHKHGGDGSKSPYEMNIVYFDALNDPTAGDSLETQVNRFMVAHAIMLALPGVPGIYFHSLFGSRNDREAALESGINRRINRQKLTQDRLEGELADPGGRRRSVFDRFRALLQARQSHPAFHPHAEQRVFQGETRLFAILRCAPGDAGWVLCLHNMTTAPITVEIVTARNNSTVTWTEIVSQRMTQVRADESFEVTLSTHEVSWLTAPGPQPIQVEARNRGSRTV